MNETFVAQKMEVLVFSTRVAKTMLALGLAERGEIDSLCKRIAETVNKFSAENVSHKRLRGLMMAYGFASAREVDGVIELLKAPVGEVFFNGTLAKTKAQFWRAARPFIMAEHVGRIMMRFGEDHDNAFTKAVLAMKAAENAKKQKEEHAANG